MLGTLVSVILIGAVVSFYTNELFGFHERAKERSIRNYQSKMKSNKATFKNITNVKDGISAWR